MKTKLGNFPWFYILFTIYPLLFLWAENISQMDPYVVIRPFLFTLVGSALLFGLLLLVFRNMIKAGMVGSLLLVAFFSYGHVYYLARATPMLNFLNHHSILAPLYLVLFGLAIWGILRVRKYGKLVPALNLTSLLLVGLSITQLSYAYIRASYASSKPVELQSGLTRPADPKDMPDIYVIVLDTYMRSDALKQDLGYDNSAFLDQLSGMGFYVAACSRPNYTFTYASISALLNMRYVPQAYENAVWGEFNDTGFWSILKKNEVVEQLKSVGYKTVAFQEEYPMLEFHDADVLIGENHPTINSAFLYPFEVLYRQSTAAIILTALDPHGKVTGMLRSKAAEKITNSVDLSGLKGDNKDLVATHIISTLFMLDHLPEVPAIVGPKFTYAHLFIPHYPYVFGPDGEIMTDPGFYSGDRGSAINFEYEKIGYVNQVQYIDKRMIAILETILEKSDHAPIIVLMGDHGLAGPNRSTNLLAYFLPNGGDSRLHPAISPVNTFRIIFSKYFGADYPPLPDQAYIDDTTVAPDDYPGCASK